LLQPLIERLIVSWVDSMLQQLQFLDKDCSAICYFWLNVTEDEGTPCDPNCPAK
jgi:hypothetical protein